MAKITTQEELLAVTKMYNTARANIIRRMKTMRDRPDDVEFQFHNLDGIEMEIMQSQDDLRLVNGQRPIYEIVYDLIMQCGRISK